MISILFAASKTDIIQGSVVDCDAATFLDASLHSADACGASIAKVTPGAFSVADALDLFAVGASETNVVGGRVVGRVSVGLDAQLEAVQVGAKRTSLDWLVAPRESGCRSEVGCECIVAKQDDCVERRIIKDGKVKFVSCPEADSSGASRASLKRTPHTFGFAVGHRNDLIATALAVDSDNHRCNDVQYEAVA